MSELRKLKQRHNMKFELLFLRGGGRVKKRKFFLIL
jgi:hypothetical protein